MQSNAPSTKKGKPTIRYYEQSAYGQDQPIIFYAVVSNQAYFENGNGRWIVSYVPVDFIIEESSMHPIDTQQLRSYGIVPFKPGINGPLLPTPDTNSTVGTQTA